MEIKKLSLAYAKKSIFKELDLNFPDDRVNVIVGPNGTGKTTLLDTMAGLYNEKTTSFDHLTVPNHEKIAYKLQSAVFFPTLTVGQTLSMFRQIDHAGQSGTSPQITKIQEKVLDQIRDTKMGQLSGGEQQLVLICGTCMLERELYLFDEPLSGVDPVNSHLIMDLISSLVTERQKKVILVSHQFNFFQEAPVWLTALNHGQLVFQGSYGDFLSQAGTDNPEIAFQYFALNK